MIKNNYSIFIIVLCICLCVAVADSATYTVSKTADKNSGYPSVIDKNEYRKIDLSVDNFVPMAPSTFVYAENFDGVTAPALPAGWTTESGGMPPAFATASDAPSSSPNFAFTNGTSERSPTNALISAPITLPIQQVSFQFSFRHTYNFKYRSPVCEDGGTLQVSIDGGAYNNVISPAVGGTFVTGSYLAGFRLFSSNPLSGQQAFCATKAGYISTIINLPGRLSGHTLKFKWIAGWDSADPNPNPAWRIDDILITSTPLAPLNIVVDSISDQPGVNACTAAPNDCSLRGAIERTNATPGDDTISFDTTVFATPQTITHSFGALVVENNGVLTINGPGANLVTLDAHNQSQVLLLNSGGTLNISGITFANGNANNIGGKGGGLQNNGGSLTVSNSAIINNRATNNGGGISGSGVTTVTNCTISGNTAVNGGGIEIAQGGTLTMTNSTVSGNTATNNAGGLLLNEAATVINSTITNNTAIGDGGGISQQDLSDISLLNTIVAGNFAATSPDFSGTINSQGFNLIGNTNGAVIGGTVTGNILNQDAKLLPLLSNNFITKTHALLPDSPAINAGTLTNAPTLDQRGKARIGNVDIGAYEAGANLVVTNTMNSGAGSLRDAISFANGTTADESITFSIPPNDAGCASQICTITLTGGELGVANNGTLIVSNTTGTDKLRVSGNNTSRVFNINSGANLTLKGLTIMNGSVNGDNGGGIRNDGTLAATNCTISNNSALNSSGGGGGIANNGTMDLFNSTVSGNSANNFNGIGGGILNIGTLNITNSTISNNTASNFNAFGGGIAVNGGTVNLSNSTISGNTTEIGGGGIYLYNLGTVNLTNMTISNNTATNFGCGVYNTGGVVNSRNSLIAENAFGFSPDFHGTLTSQGYNFIGTIAQTTITGDTTGNIIDQPARLAPLGFYGGSTQTHALVSNSPAIDVGNATTSPAADQRGAARINTADIGAFELNNTANGGTFVATMPNGSQGVGYNYTLIPNDNGITYSITSGSLPNGLSLTTNLAGIKSEEKLSSPTAVVAIGGTPTLGGIFNFTVTATNGVNSTATNYSLFVRSLIPTASTATVSGRVFTPTGRGLGNAFVVMTNQNGERVSVRTNPFGYYRFTEVQSGETYVFSVASKRYQFATQVVNIAEDLDGLNFFAQ